MYTINDAEKILNTFHISNDIQKKILLLFISLGTPSAKIIKQECLKLNIIRYYNDDNIETLWRLKLWNSNYDIIKTYYNKLNEAYCELSIAALIPFPHSNYEDTQNHPINIFTKSYLYRMFYNLDKFHYGEYGTPTANIIRNYITNNIIKYSK